MRIGIREIQFANLLCVFPSFTKEGLLGEGFRVENGGVSDIETEIRGGE